MRDRLESDIESRTICRDYANLSSQVRSGDTRVAWSCLCGTSWQHLADRMMTQRGFTELQMGTNPAPTKIRS